MGVMNNGYLLEMRNISKEFPGVKALDGVDLSLESGEVHVLLWSQMHGDESTATMALFDIFNFIKFLKPLLQTAHTFMTVN